MFSVRTNNDVEGWHHGLRRRANGRSGLPFYLLVNLLHEEARLTAARIRLVSELKLAKVQRKKHKSVQANNKEKTLEQLLKAASYLNRPTIS